MELTCRSCGVIGEPVLERKQQHLGAYCTSCHQWIKWVAQDEVPHLYVGKYRGQPINEVFLRDPQYCAWLVEQRVGGKRVLEWLEKKFNPQGNK